MSAADVPAARRGRVKISDAAAVGMASAAAAVSGFLTLLLVARTVSVQDNADFLVFWSLMFGAFGISGGITNETTRSVASSRGREPAGVRVMGSALLVGAVLALALVVSAPLWASSALGDGRAAPSALILAVAVWAYGGECGYAGVLSGLARWRRYSALLVTEAGLRLGLVGAACAAGAAVLGLELAAATTAVTWLAVAATGRGARQPLGTRADVVLCRHLVRIGQSMLGTASSAALVVGFPVLLRLTSARDVYAHAAPLVLAVSLTRAPLLIPLGAYQGMVISRLQGGGATASFLWRSVTAVAVLAGTGVGVAYVIGPALMVLLFGSEYHVAPGVLAGLTAAAAVLALLTLSGSVLLALDRHRVYATGWLVATAGCVGVLLLPSGVATRTILSLVLGPVLGLVVHATALRRPRPRDQVPP